MQSEKNANPYIGDESFQKLLDHYQCPTPLNVIKMRFVGAVCSPNLELRPAEVISSFWPAGEEPRLQTKEEADLFFKFFMGLWDDIFEKVKRNKIKIPPLKTDRKNLKKTCDERFEAVEFGFLEGFWGGKEDLRLPAYIAQMIDSLSEISGIYKTLAKKLDNGADLEEIAKTLGYTDIMMEKALSFIIENSVLPRIDNLARVVH